MTSFALLQFGLSLLAGLLGVAAGWWLRAASGTGSKGGGHKTYTCEAATVRGGRSAKPARGRRNGSHMRRAAHRVHAHDPVGAERVDFHRTGDHHERRRVDHRLERPGAASDRRHSTHAGRQAARDSRLPCQHRRTAVHVRLARPAEARVPSGAVVARSAGRRACPAK